MNKDWVIWLGCALLIGCGVGITLLAVGSEAGPRLVSWLAAEGTTAKSFFEFLSYIAAVALAVTAIATSLMWRKQFLYTKRYEAFLKLNDALQGLDVFRSWAAAYSDSHFRKYMKTADDETDRENEAYVLKKANEIPKAWRDYRLAIYGAAVHMKQSDLEPCLYADHVREKLLKPAQEMQKYLDAYYDGRALSQEEWHHISAYIRINCSYIQSDCQRITEVGERYIFRQLEHGVS